MRRTLAVAVVATTAALLTGPSAFAGSAEVRGFHTLGSPSGLDFFAYPAAFAGGAYVAGAKLNGDTTAEIITGAGPGGGPHVQAFKADGMLFTTQTGTQASFYAYGSAFRGGVRVAAGNLGGDAQDEIITGAGAGGGPHVRAFNTDGTPFVKPGQTTETSFLAFPATFKGGIYVASGDVDGDGDDEIIVGAGPGGGPSVRVFQTTGTLVADFFAYDPAFRGGVTVAAGDIDNDGVDEIITGAGPGGGPDVRAFNLDTSRVADFFAYDPAFRGGVNVGTSNLGGDTGPEIITAPTGGGGPHVRGWNTNGTPFVKPGQTRETSFFAYEGTFKGGVNLAGGNLDGDADDEIITVRGPGS